MIFFLVTRGHAYTIQTHLQTWGRPLRQRIHPIYYDQLAHYRRLEGGTWIFTDLERLNAAELEVADLAWSALARLGPAVRLLNRPSQVLNRAALLQMLHARGLNPFNAAPAEADVSHLRFPVFLRRCDEHDGSLSPLLHTPQQVQETLAALERGGLSRGQLLAVEHCDTADAGVYRKYAAFVVGGRIIPRHLLLSRQWVVKFADLVDPAAVAEESDYLNNNPHQGQLAQIASLAHVDFGRFDYAVRDGRVIIWEINTNPMLSVEPMKLAPARLPGLARCMAQLQQALEAIDLPTQPAAVAFNPPAALRRRLGQTTMGRLKRATGVRLRRLGEQWPWNHLLAAAQ